MSTRRSTRSNSRQQQRRDAPAPPRRARRPPAPQSSSRPRPPTKRYRSQVDDHNQDQEDEDGQDEEGEEDDGQPIPKLKSPKPEPARPAEQHHHQPPAPSAGSTMTMEWPDSALAASINHLACHLFDPSSFHSLDGSALYALGMLIKTHADSFFEPPPPPVPEPAEPAAVAQSVQDEAAALHADLDARRPIDHSDTRVAAHLAKVRERTMSKEDHMKQKMREAVAKGQVTLLARRTAEYAKYGLNVDGTRLGVPPKVKIQRPVVEDQTFHALGSNQDWCALCRKLTDATNPNSKYTRPTIRLVYSAVVDAYVPLRVCLVCSNYLLTRPVHCPYCYRICPASHVSAACKYVQDNPSAAVRSKIKAGNVPEPLKCPKCTHRMRVLDDDDPLLVKRIEEVELPKRATRVEEVPEEDEAAPVDWPSRVAAEQV